MDPKPCTTRLLDQKFGMCISPEDMILPFYNFHGTNYCRPWKFFTEGNTDFGSTIDNTKDKMKITLDVQHFRPNEISVKVDDREIFIEGKHEERLDEHGFVSRQFTRRYFLPKDYQSETVTSTLSSDGVLLITANKNSSTKIPANERVVPIKMSGLCPPKLEEKKIEQCPKEESTVMLETSKEIKEDAKTACSKKDLPMMVKEDHCRLLKSDLLGEALSSTEKILSESRKETDELLKLMSSNTSTKATTSAASGKFEEVLGECKSANTKLTEKASEMTMASESEVSCSKNSMTSEKFDSQETSTSISQSSMSMQSSMKATHETLREMICAELKEAAENI